MLHFRLNAGRQNLRVQLLLSSVQFKMAYTKSIIMHSTCFLRVALQRISVIVWLTTVLSNKITKCFLTIEKTYEKVCPLGKSKRYWRVPIAKIPPLSFPTNRRTETFTVLNGLCKGAVKQANTICRPLERRGKTKTQADSKQRAMTYRSLRTVGHHFLLVYSWQESVLCKETFKSRQKTEQNVSPITREN